MAEEPQKASLPLLTAYAMAVVAYAVFSIVGIVWF